jgi:hypothetical protein
VTEVADVGVVPYGIVVHLVKSDADFNATIKRSDLSPFPSSAAVVLKIFTASPTVWTATIGDYTDEASVVHPRALASWRVDKVAVAALVPGTSLLAHVVYTDDTGADLVWFSGKVKWHA